MMKVGIMSMQRIVNYGSFLQAFALKNIIEDLGHKTVFVDYRVEPPLIHDPTLIKNGNKGNLNFWMKCVAKKCMCVQFDSTYIHKMSLLKLGITETMHYQTDVDVLVIGSDEVFNCLQANPDVGYSLELFGKNNRAKRLISYAASFGHTTFEGLEQFGKYDEIKDLINRFDSVSVRDANSLELVRRMGIENAELHFDPVLVYDFSEKVIEKKDISDYVLVYSYAGRIKAPEEIKAIRSFAEKHGKKTVSIGNHQEWTDIKLQANAFELLGYIKNADYVVTDTFHGTVFSIIMKKNFATMIRGSNRQKLTALLDMLCLSSRNAADISGLEAILQIPVDYEKTDAVIEREKKHTVDYLTENLRID